MFLSHFLWTRALALLKLVGIYQDSQVVPNKNGVGLCLICTVDNFRGISSAEFLRMENFRSKTDLGSNAFPGNIRSEQLELCLEPFVHGKLFVTVKIRGVPCWDIYIQLIAAFDKRLQVELILKYIQRQYVSANAFFTGHEPN